MIPFIRNTIFLLVIFISSDKGYCQEYIRQIPCYDESVRLQLDSLKSSLTCQGFILLKEASMVMENENELPVLAPFTEGARYQIMFIGDPGARFFAVGIYNDAGRQIFYKKQGWENNVISYSFIPEQSEYHTIRPIQGGKKKKKDFCGHIILFKKDG